MNLAERVVTVVGAGESGIASARLLERAGARVRVTSTGELPAEFARWCARKRIPVETGAHTEAFLAPSSLIVVSPGVKPDSPVIRFAAKRKIKVWSEIELAASQVTGKLAAVTGTNGKTTTSTLLWEMMRRHRPCHLCGNIGNSLAASILEKGPKMDRVVEVSSFQMKYIDRFRPDAAAVLNLSPNHLDWHPTLQDYYRSKMRVAENQTARQTLVLNADDPQVLRHAAGLRSRKVFFSLKPLRDGLTVSDGWIVRMAGGKPSRIADLRRFRLKGQHNLQNALAAAGAALSLGVPPRAVASALAAARPLPHRVEEIGTVRGVRFVNDSKSTTAMSTAAAIRGFDRGIVLVAGGRRKQKSFKEVYPDVRRRVSAVVFYGEAGDSLHQEFAFFKNRSVVRAFEAAVRRAFREAAPGQVLLLSPMCSSFDQFASYRARGEAFREIFRRLREEAR